MKLYIAAAGFALLFESCSTVLAILDALPSPTPVTVTCSEIDMRPTGNYCGGIPCDVNTNSCDASGCSCTTSGPIHTP